MMMDLNKYQAELESLNKYFTVQGDPFEFNCIGLAEEAGEIMGKLKRALRGEGFDRKAYLSELGDVLGYLALAAGYRNITMHLVASGMTPQPKIYTDFQLHIISASKKLYSSADKLLNTTQPNDSTHILWLLTDIAEDINRCVLACESTLEEVMELNLTKLRDRLERNGTLLGAGDNR